MDSERRRSLVWIGRGVAGACAAVVALLTGRFVRPLPLQDWSRRVALGPPTAFPRGSVVHLSEPDVHVFHVAAGVYAVSGRCTHLGCSLLRKPEGFSCPCHGAQFDLEGHVRSGPAPRPLRWLAVSVTRGGELVVHLDREVPVGTMLRV